MSTLMSPIGPLPPGVYWRRRLAVIGVLVLVLLLIWFLFFRGSGGDGGDATPTPTPTPTETEAPTPTPEPTPPPTPSPTRSDDLCLDQDILVEAGSELPIYPVGSTPTLTLTIINIGTVECRRDVGPGANELKIELQGQVLWSSDDCNPSEASDIVSLKRGDEFTTQLMWDGRTSEEGCPSDQPLVEAGEYTVVGRNGTIESLPTAIRLE